MAAKTCIFLCAVALFVQGVVSQCLGRVGPGLGPLRTELTFDGLAYDGLYSPAWNTGLLGCGAIAPACAGTDIAVASSLNAAYGGGLPVASASATPPTGLAVTSENAYEGAVAVGGNLPFLGTVAMEGVFPTAGAGAISYGCGDGVVAITAEGPVAGPGVVGSIAPMAAMGPAAAYTPYGAAYGYAGLPARTCGCGATYV